MNFLTHSTSSNRFNKLNYTFLLNYLKKKLYPSTQVKLMPRRDVKISALFDKGDCYVHQGRVFVKVSLKVEKIGFKFGMFCCTKKPFNFRPKKTKQKR